MNGVRLMTDCNSASLARSASSMRLRSVKAWKLHTAPCSRPDLLLSGATFISTGTRDPSGCSMMTSAPTIGWPERNTLATGVAAKGSGAPSA